VLIGGVTQTASCRFHRESRPGIDFILPKEAPYFEAFGAAHLARTQGALLPEGDPLRQGSVLVFKTYKPLSESGDLVHHAPSRRGAYDPDASMRLALTAAPRRPRSRLINVKTLEIVAEHYGRTHGDPIAALRDCLREVKKQLGDRKPRISLVATTGSSRELLGVFLETVGVYNEIIAHTVVRHTSRRMSIRFSKSADKTPSTCSSTTASLSTTR